jgi:hypothetical protein
VALQALAAERLDGPAKHWREYADNAGRGKILASEGKEAGGERAPGTAEERGSVN